MNNYLSIDLESWASPPIPEYVNLSSQEKKRIDSGHIKKSTLYILDLLNKHKTKLTFFIVGQFYDWYPEVVESIANAGHEVAYHTHYHDALVDEQSLTASMIASEKFLSRFKPVGFRAPRISLKNKNLLKILKKYGFKYDSSSYGAYKDKRKIHGIWELPVTSYAGMPIGSGYFIGLLGKKIKWLYDNVNQNGSPVISFIHNWQIVKPIKPTFPTKKYLVTHPYYFPYLADCASAFEYLITQFKFIPMKNLLR